MIAQVRALLVLKFPLVGTLLLLSTLNPASWRDPSDTHLKMLVVGSALSAWSVYSDQGWGLLATRLAIYLLDPATAFWYIVWDACSACAFEIGLLGFALVMELIKKL